MTTAKALGLTIPPSLLQRAEQAEARRNAEEAAMEFDSQTERLPFHEPDEAEPAPPGAAAVL